MLQQFTPAVKKLWMYSGTVCTLQTIECKRATIHEKVCLKLFRSLIFNILQRLPRLIWFKCLFYSFIKQFQTVYWAYLRTDMHWKTIHIHNIYYHIKHIKLVNLASTFSIVYNTKQELGVELHYIPSRSDSMTIYLTNAGTWLDWFERVCTTAYCMEAV